MTTDVDLHQILIESWVYFSDLDTYAKRRVRMAIRSIVAAALAEGTRVQDLQGRTLRATGRPDYPRDLSVRVELVCEEERVPLLTFTILDLAGEEGLHPGSLTARIARPPTRLPPIGTPCSSVRIGSWLPYSVFSTPACADVDAESATSTSANEETNAPSGLFSRSPRGLLFQGLPPQGP